MSARSLTSAEKQAAPAWATHFFVTYRTDKVIFINKDKQDYRYQGAVVTQSLEAGDNTHFIDHSCALH